MISILARSLSEYVKARFLTDKRDQATMRAHAVPVSMVMREKTDMLREIVTKIENKKNREAYDSKA